MSFVLVGPKVFFGTPSEAVRAREVRGLPEGTTKYRLRFRNTDFARIFTRGAYGTRHFILTDGGDHLAIDPDLEQGHNLSPAAGRFPWAVPSSPGL